MSRSSTGRGTIEQGRLFIAGRWGTDLSISALGTVTEILSWFSGIPFSEDIKNDEEAMLTWVGTNIDTLSLYAQFVDMSFTVDSN